jgi:hypothetical protein
VLRSHNGIVLMSSGSRSKHDFLGRTEIWRYIWLSEIESYSEFAHEPIVAPSLLSNGALMNRSEEKTELQGFLLCLRSYGSLEAILAMIEDGEQGEIFRNRINTIRENELLMKRLTELWEDKTLGCSWE